MRYLLFSVWFCSCASRTYSESGFQSWVTDPRYSFYPTLPNVAPQSKDEMCRAHSRIFLSELENKTLWAVQMWDSSAKAPVGIVSGSVYHFGNFDECFKTSAPFTVQFCVAHVFANISSELWDFHLGEKIQPESNIWSYVAEKPSESENRDILKDVPHRHSGIGWKPRDNPRVRSRVDISKVPRDVLAWGLCAPASCKSSDLEEAINAHVMSLKNDLFNETTFGVMVNRDFCTKPTDYIEFTFGEIAFWTVLFTLILLTSTGTIMDLMPSNEEIKHSKIYELWMFFSVRRNLSHVLPVEKQEKSALDVFHGIKFVSILFILYGHRIGVSISLSTMNYDEVEDHLINDNKMFFVHTDLVVDTFFFISGLLACYIMMDISSKRFINPIHAILVRISRLAPLYFFIVWFQSTAAFRMGSGPLWNAIAKNETDYCVDHWWSNVFFFSNYYKTDEMCLPHSWFLPCELHFFTLAAILIPVLVKFPTFGKILLGILIAVSAIIPSVVIYMSKVQPLILFYYEFLTQPRKYDSFNVLYVKSHNRATAYLIGTAVGLYLHHTKNCKTRISKKLTLCGTLAWLAFLFAPMAYGSLYYDLSKTHNVIEAAAFGSLRRVSWAIGFAFFILTHRFGTIPLVDFFFSSKLAVFCSRLTYGIYLIHYIIITIDVLKTRSARVFSVHDAVIAGFGDILKSVTITLLLIFILEIPLKRILREVIFAKEVKELQKPAEVQNVCTVRL